MPLGLQLGGELAADLAMLGVDLGPVIAGFIIDVDHVWDGAEWQPIDTSGWTPPPANGFSDFRQVGGAVVATEHSFGLNLDAPLYLSTDVLRTLAPFPGIGADNVLAWDIDHAGNVYAAHYTVGDGFSIQRCAVGYTAWESLYADGWTPYPSVAGGATHLAVSGDGQYILFHRMTGPANTDQENVYSGDGGSSFSVVNSDRPSASTTRPNYLGRGTGGRFFQFGNNFGSPAGATNPYYTDDGGASWTACSLSPAGASTTGNCLAQNPRASWGDRNVMACYRNGDALVYVYGTEDDGATWTKLAQFTPAGASPGAYVLTVTAVDYDAANDRILVGAVDTYQYAWLIDGAFDGGATVSEIRVPPDQTYNVGSVPGPNFLDYANGGVLDAAVAEAASREFNELAIILKGTNLAHSVYYTPDFHDPSLWLRCVDAPVRDDGTWLAPDFELGKFLFGFHDEKIYRMDVVGGVPTATLAPAALAGGDQANHGVWVGGVLTPASGVYLIAAENGIYKTWDRAATIGVVRGPGAANALFAGSHPKMVSISLPVAETPPAVPPGTPAPVTPPAPSGSSPDIWTVASAGGTYVPVGFRPANGFRGEIVTDPAFISISSGYPLKDLVVDIGWNVGPTGAQQQVHVDPTMEHDGSWNGCARFLCADGVTFYEGQKLLLTPGGTPHVNYAEELADDRRNGCHGGSDLSTFGTLLPGWSGGAINHRLGINILAANYLSHGRNGLGFVYPADTADSSYLVDYNGVNPDLCMGSQLQLPPGADTSFVTNARVQLLVTALRTYGAWVCDDTSWDVYAFHADRNAEWGDGPTFHSELMSVIGLLQVFLPT